MLALGERTRGRLGGRRRRIMALAVRQSRLDDERIAAVDRGRPGDRGVKVSLDLLVQAVEDRLLPDGRDAVRRRRHDLGRLDGLVERLGVGAVDVPWPRVRRQRGRAADLVGHSQGDPAELAGEESSQGVAPGVVEHPQEHAELDPVGMRLDLARRGRQLVDRPPVLPGLPIRRVVDEGHVGVGDRGLLEILVHRGAALLVASLDLQGHLGPSLALPVDLPALEDSRLVLLGIDLDLEVVGGGAGGGPRGDLHRSAGRQLGVHAGRRDPDALLAAAHAQPVELGPVEQLGEDRRNLLPDDARTVVDDREAEPRRLARRGQGLPVARHDLDLHDDVGQDARFLGRVERVVDRFLDAGEESLSGTVEAEEVPVLGEELGDGDLALTRAHLDGGDGGPRRRRPGRGQCLRHLLP
jgi:hypothetical protein